MEALNYPWFGKHLGMKMDELHQHLLENTRFVGHFACPSLVQNTDRQKDIPQCKIGPHSNLPQLFQILNLMFS